jgi:hypothetical protein
MKDNVSAHLQLYRRLDLTLILLKQRLNHHL